MTGGRPAGRLARALLLLLVVSVGRAGRAAAPSRQRPTARPSRNRRALEARRACAAGRVEQGIELLAQIIAETGDPNAVYNQARCYQGNGRAEQALTRFREYLRIAGPLPPRERQRVRRFIVELEQEVEARGRRREALPAAARAAGPAGPAARARSSAAVVTETAPPVAAASGALRRLRSPRWRPPSRPGAPRRAPSTSACRPAASRDELENQRSRRSPRPTSIASARRASAPTPCSGSASPSAARCSRARGALSPLPPRRPNRRGATVTLAPLSRSRRRRPADRPLLMGRRPMGDRSAKRWRCFVAATLLAGGCFSPRVPDGIIICNRSSDCPAGLICTPATDGTAALCCRGGICPARISGDSGALPPRAAPHLHPGAGSDAASTPPRQRRRARARQRQRSGPPRCTSRSAGAGPRPRPP